MRYESEIERVFGQAIQPELCINAAIKSQCPIETSFRNYRMDFVIACGHFSVCVECDGRDFHDFNADRRRDIAILTTGQVHEIFRFRGCDVFHDVQSQIEFMRSYSPYLFDGEKERYALSEKAMLGKGIHTRHDKPIHRTVGLSKRSEQDCYNTIWKIRAGAMANLSVVEFKSFNWNRTSNRSSPLKVALEEIF